MNNHLWAFLNERENIYWKGFCRKNRNSCIYEIENIVNRYGSIMDFKMFSDLEIGIKIEIAEQKVYKLHKDLIEIIEIDDFGDLKSESNTERTILLNVTFLQGTGDMKIEGPIGPG